MNAGYFMPKGGHGGARKKGLLKTQACLPDPWAYL